MIPVQYVNFDALDAVESGTLYDPQAFAAMQGLPALTNLQVDL